MVVLSRWSSPTGGWVLLHGDIFRSPRALREKPMCCASLHADGFRSGNAAASLKPVYFDRLSNHSASFRSGNAAASLKPRQSLRQGRIRCGFPQRQRCGLIEAARRRAASSRSRARFPQRQRGGLIEASARSRSGRHNSTGFRSGNAAASLKHRRSPRSEGNVVSFRSGNAAASLKPLSV